MDNKKNQEFNKAVESSIKDEKQIQTNKNNLTQETQTKIINTQVLSTPSGINSTIINVRVAKEQQPKKISCVNLKYK